MAEARFAELDVPARLALLDALLRDAPIGVGVLDADLRYLTVNRLLADTNGRPAAQHVGRSLREVVGEAAADGLEPVLREVIATGLPLTGLELRVGAVGLAEVERAFTASFHPLRVGADVVGVVGIVSETSAEDATVEVLRASETRYRSLVEATASEVWRIVPGDREADRLVDRVHPEDRARIRASWDRSVESAEVFDEECRLVDGDAVRHVIVRAVPIVDAGAVREWVGATTDVTATRAAEEALRDADARLRLAVEAGGIGTYDWDFGTGAIAWSAETAAMYGMTLEEFGGDWASFARNVHPDDVAAIEAEVGRVAPILGAFQAEMRVWRDGGWNARVLSKGQVLPDASGRPARMVGMTADVTEARRETERVGHILESIADAFYALDGDWCFTYVNAEAERLLERPQDELLGRSIWDEFPEAVGSEFDRAYRRAAEEDVVVAFEAYYPPLDGWFDLRVFPSDDGISVYFRNIDAERAAAQERRVLEEQRAAAAARTVRIGEVASALTEALSEADVARLVLVQATAAVGARGGGLALYDPEGTHLRWVAVEGYTPEQREAVWASPLDVDRPLTRAMRTRLPEYLPSADDLREAFPAVADILTGIGDEAVCSIPLVAGGRCLGAFTLTFTSARPFAVEDRLLLSALADTTAQAIERARLYDREHRVAETLQRALLPERLADPPAVSSAARYLPGTEGVAVGGDWYDLFDLGSNRLGIALGDVVGKGVAAAAVMGRLRNAVRAFATSTDGPADVLTRVDDFADRFGSNDLATLVYGVLDVGTGELRFSSAGHLPPLLIDSRGAHFLPQEPDVPVGVASDEVRHEHRVRLEAGAMLVLYSDGLVEDRARSLDEGLTLLADTLAPHAGAAAGDVEEVCEGIVHDLVGDAGGADDVAVLVLHWAGAASWERCSVVLPPAVASARRARALVGEELERWGEAALHETAALCVSEIVTNAVVHAGTAVHLEVTLLPERVRVEVVDGGVAPPERVEADVDAVHGRGIAIVEMLSADWGVEPRDDGKCVWFELERTR